MHVADIKNVAAAIYLDAPSELLLTRILAKFMSLLQISEPMLAAARR